MELRAAGDQDSYRRPGQLAFLLAPNRWEVLIRTPPDRIGGPSCAGRCRTTLRCCTDQPETVSHASRRAKRSCELHYGKALQRSDQRIRDGPEVGGQFLQ